MSKLINAKIDVKKINKDLLFKGEKGTYLDLTIWINDAPDKFGNEVSIEQRTAKGEAKIYLGNGKFYKAKSEPAVETRESIMNAPDFNDPNNDLPF
jgi:hypothetical protein